MRKGLWVLFEIPLCAHIPRILNFNPFLDSVESELPLKDSVTDWNCESFRVAVILWVKSWTFTRYHLTTLSTGTSVMPTRWEMTKLPLFCAVHTYMAAYKVPCEWLYGVSMVALDDWKLHSPIFTLIAGKLNYCPVVFSSSLLISIFCNGLLYLFVYRQTLKKHESVISHLKHQQQLHHCCKCWWNGKMLNVWRKFF